MTPTTTTVTVSVSSGSTGCSGQVQVTVNAQTPSGPVSDGTAVALSVNLGSIFPNAGSTFGGGLFALYTAPPTTGGTATITATVSGASGSAVVTVLCPVAAATLAFPTTQCVNFPPTGAVVSFTWQPAQGATVQWLDLSLSDNNFAPGTFLGAGPLDPATGALTWAGLLPGRPHFWRVNALTPSGWVTSATGAFVPCGGPAIRSVDWSCTGGGTAVVRFHWAPASSAGSFQFLDLTLFDNGFVPGTFLGMGPLSPTLQDGTWVGILANRQHFWRVNELSVFGWSPTQTGTFVASC